MIENLQDLRFAYPLWLCALAILPVVAWLRGRKATSAIILPFAGAWRRHSFAGSSRLPSILAFLAAVAMIVALARPQSVATERQSKSMGYDIMLAIDLSRSMEAEDYVRDRRRINRLEAVKPVLSSFIQKRENDRIGLIAFAGRAYTVSPLTFDHQWLARQAERMKIGLVEDGTAIGDTLAVATARLREGAKQRAGEREGAFIILLTDGENTAGLLQPMEGAELAKEAGVKVYTIAAGQNGYVPFPVYNQQGDRIGTRQVLMPVDMDSLKQVATDTGGAFFHSESSDTIESAFQQIDESAKIDFEVRQFSVVTELFPYALGAAAIFAVAASLGAAQPRREAIA